MCDICGEDQRTHASSEGANVTNVSRLKFTLTNPFLIHSQLDFSKCGLEFVEK